MKTLFLALLAVTLSAETVIPVTFSATPGMSTVMGDFSILISAPCSVGTCAADITITSEPQLLVSSEGDDPTRWTYQVVDSVTLDSQGNLVSMLFMATSTQSGQTASLLCINTTDTTVPDGKMQCPAWYVGVGNGGPYFSQNTTGIGPITFPVLTNDPPPNYPGDSGGGLGGVVEPETWKLMVAGGLLGIAWRLKIPRRGDEVFDIGMICVVAAMAAIGLLNGMFHISSTVCDKLNAKWGGK